MYSAWWTGARVRGPWCHGQLPCNITANVGTWCWSLSHHHCPSMGELQETLATEVPCMWNSSQLIFHIPAWRWWWITSQVTLARLQRVLQWYPSHSCACTLCGMHTMCIHFTHRATGHLEVRNKWVHCSMYTYTCGDARCDIHPILPPLLQLLPMEEGECTLGEGGEATLVTGHFEVGDAATEDFWEPPDEIEDLYDQLWQRKYHEIPRKSIEWVWNIFGRCTYMLYILTST